MNCTNLDLINGTISVRVRNGPERWTLLNGVTFNLVPVRTRSWAVTIVTSSIAPWFVPAPNEPEPTWPWLPSPKSTNAVPLTTLDFSLGSPTSFQSPNCVPNAWATVWKLEAKSRSNCVSGCVVVSTWWSASGIKVRFPIQLNDSSPTGLISLDAYGWSI